MDVLGQAPQRETASSRIRSWVRRSAKATKREAYRATIDRTDDAEVAAGNRLIGDVVPHLAWTIFCTAEATCGLPLPVM
jgi:hypothetical protein